MRNYLVSLALVVVLGLAIGASTFTGAQETETPTDLSGSCVSVVSSPELDGTPDVGTPDVGTPDVGTPDVGTPDVGTPDVGTPDVGTPDVGTPEVGTPAADGTPDMSATPQGSTGTPEGTPSAEDCSTPESTPDV